jgi:ferrous iron transport protein A
MATTLQQLKPGDRAKVIGYAEAEGVYARQLLSLGLIPGTVLAVERVAPLGDPVEIGFRGMHLALRPGEAEGLALEKL